MVAPQDLRMTAVKVFFSRRELADLDARRGRFGRAVFLRAAGLGAQLHVPAQPEAVTTWVASARVQACLTQINRHAELLNGLALSDGQQAVVDQLLSVAPKLLEDFKEFRLTALGEPSKEF